MVTIEGLSLALKDLDIVRELVGKMVMDTARQTRDPAPSGPAPASREPVRLPGEPVLFEKDGWGIYSKMHDRQAEGSCLTHIGCDCEFPYWSFSHRVSSTVRTKNTFVCPECGARLNEDALKELIRVYCFLNNEPLEFNEP